MHVKRPLSHQPLPSHAKRVFQGRLFGVYEWEQEMFDGTKEIFEKIARQDTVSIIAVTKDKKILVSFQEQPGIEPFIGLLGGIVDKGEEPFAAAERELLEEAGYTSRKWELFESVQPTTKIDWAIFTFIAKECEKVQKQHLDAGEKIEIKEVSFEEFLRIVANPLFRDKELALKMLRLQVLGKIDELRAHIIG